MRRIIGTLAGVLVLGFSLTFGAGIADAPLTAQEKKTSDNGELFASYIDGIKIPTDVLLKIQMDYQGYAVTKAQKIIRDGKHLYRLRVDRDSLDTDYKSFYLLYSMKWKRVGKDKMTAPIQPVAPTPKPEPNENPVPQNANNNEEERGDDNHGRGSGGRGGGNEEPPEEEEPEEPPEEPEEPEEPAEPEE